MRESLWMQYPCTVGDRWTPKHIPQPRQDLVGSVSSSSKSKSRLGSGRVDTLALLTHDLVSPAAEKKTRCNVTRGACFYSLLFILLLTLSQQAFEKHEDWAASKFGAEPSARGYVDTLKLAWERTSTAGCVLASLCGLRSGGRNRVILGPVVHRGAAGSVDFLGARKMN